MEQGSEGKSPPPLSLAGSCFRTNLLWHDWYLGSFENENYVILDHAIRKNRSQFPNMMASTSDSAYPRFLSKTGIFCKSAIVSRSPGDCFVRKPPSGSLPIADCWAFPASWQM